MKYYAVIDTNVLVSAMLKWNSIPGHVMELVFEGPIVPLLDERIVKEYREVLARPKFHLTEDIIEDVLENIERNGIYVDAKPLDVELPDSKDMMFYEVVMEERSMPSRARRGSVCRKFISCDGKYKALSSGTVYRYAKGDDGYHPCRH